LLGSYKSLARPTSRCILFDCSNTSFDASLVIYINSTNSKSSVAVSCFLPGRAKDLPAPLYVTPYRAADKSLARPTSRYILFDCSNTSFDVSLVIYINSTTIPPIMIINRIYEHQNLLSL
jgi:hypothetical protein